MRISIVLVVFLSWIAHFVNSNSSESMDHFEDITMDGTNPTTESISTTTSASRPQFSTVGSTVSEKAKKSMIDYFSKRKKNTEPMESMRFLPTLPPTHSSSHNGYGAPPPKRKQREEQAPVSRDSSQDRQIEAGVPDTSDPCFRRYANCIVVNAQPYERRSSTDLRNCKLHCLHSQTGVYSCRAFVYDNVNQVCDLFAHVGDQPPARLLKFQSRDYFEPTAAIQCEEPTKEPEIVARASNIDERKEEADKVKVREKEGLVAQKTTVEEIIGKQCPRGKRTGFLRTAGFELFNNDDVTIEVEDVSECTAACENNRVSGASLECNSFDFSSSLARCSFSKEAAVPVGDGQLKQNKDSDYYERICVSQNLPRWGNR